MRTKNGSSFSIFRFQQHREGSGLVVRQRPGGAPVGRRCRARGRDASVGRRRGAPGRDSRVGGLRRRHGGNGRGSGRRRRPGRRHRGGLRIRCLPGRARGVRPAGRHRRLGEECGAGRGHGLCPRRDTVRGGRGLGLPGGPARRLLRLLAGVFGLEFLQRSHLLVGGLVAEGAQQVDGLLPDPGLEFGDEREQRQALRHPALRPVQPLGQRGMAAVDGEQPLQRVCLVAFSRSWRWTLAASADSSNSSEVLP